MFNLDIYFENPVTDAGSLDEIAGDLYLNRRWTIVPQIGETIVYERREDDGNTSSWTAKIKDRVFVTDDDGNLRIQLHCSGALLTGLRPSEGETADTL